MERLYTKALDWLPRSRLLKLSMLAFSLPTICFAGSWIYLGIPIVHASPFAIAVFSFNLSIRLLIFAAISQTTLLVLVYIIWDSYLDRRITRRMTSYLREKPNLSRSTRFRYKRACYRLKIQGVEALIGGRNGLALVAIGMLLLMAAFTPSFWLVFMYLGICFLMSLVTIGVVAKNVDLSAQILLGKEIESAAERDKKDEIAEQNADKLSFIELTKFSLSYFLLILRLTKPRVNLETFLRSPFLPGFVVSTALFVGAVSSPDRGGETSTAMYLAEGNVECVLMLANLGDRFAVLSSAEELEIVYKEEVIKFTKEANYCRARI